MTHTSSRQILHKELTVATTTIPNQTFSDTEGEIGQHQDQDLQEYLFGEVILIPLSLCASMPKKMEALNIYFCAHALSGCWLILQIP